MTPAILLLGFVTLERLAELLLARRNTARLVAGGAVEVGSGHYPLIVSLHALWLAGLWIAARDHPVSLPWLGAFAGLQVLRAWVLLTLGSRWTTRIIVANAAPLVTSGPYRFVAHPNYLVVAGEIAVLPLCLGMPWYALLFSVANALVLTIRIKSENAALVQIRSSGPRATG